MAEVQLKGSTSGESILKAPAEAGSNTTITLPKASIDFSTAGSDGQFLKTNGAGTLSFATPTDTTTPANDTVTAAKTDLSIVSGDIIYGDGTDSWERLPKGTDGQILKLASGVPSWAAAAAGTNLLQIKGTTASNIIEPAATTWTDFTNLSVNITPSATTSSADHYLFCWVTMQIEVDGGEGGVRFKRVSSGDTDATGGGGSWTDTWGDGLFTRTEISQMIMFEILSTNQHTISIQVYEHSGAWYFGGQGRNATLFVAEVKDRD